MAKASLLSNLAANHWYRRAERRRYGGYLAAAHRDFARAARAGYAPAQYMLARAYQTGQGCIRSGALAEHWYRAAAENNHIDSQFELGLILLNRRDLNWAAGSSASWLSSQVDAEDFLAETLFPSAGATASDPHAAFPWLMKAAMAGKPEAQANLGWLLLKGSGCDTDRTEAHRWLSAAANRNISQAALGLAEYYSEAGAPDYDIAVSVHWAKNASQLGNGSGSQRFGVALRDGVGVARDTLEAERIFNLAVDQGHPTAGYDLAELILAREATAGQFQSSIEHLRQCAKRNHIPSALLLADIYGRGDHMRPDLREVAHWYKAAADLGHPQARFMMGCLYARGDGVVSDLKHAARCFELAAQSGHAQAAFNLGIFYLNGQGVEPSRHDAKRWLEIASNAGLAQAQLRLGKILAVDSTTPAEAASARALIERAADAGSVEAKISLARMLLADDDLASEQLAIELLTVAMEVGDVEACELLLKKRSGSDLDTVVQALQHLNLQGNVRAKVVLAEVLLAHEHIPRDPARAITLLREGTEAGSAQAYFLTGVLFCQGTYVTKDLQQGYRYYLKAANCEHPLAQYNTGIMLLQGLGVEKNVEEAVVWIRRAGGHSLQKAIDFIREVEQKALLAHANG